MIVPEIGESILDYDVLEEIGRGGFAIVYKAKCHNTHQEVAIKKINKISLTKDKIIERVRQEVSIHSKLDHPSILKLYTFFEDDFYVYLVLELCPNGHLSQRIPFPEKEAQDYLAQVVDGVLYLHSQGIMHRDLSLPNLLLDSRGHIKIADFGLATQLKRPEDRHTTMCGTPNYISPEVATRSSHGLEADVWSLGCLLYTMLVGKPPFEMTCAKSTLTKVVIGNYQIPSFVSRAAHDLITKCLVKNPKERIRLKDIHAHGFLDGAGSSSSSSSLADSGLCTISTTTTHHAREGEAPLPTIREGGHDDEHHGCRGRHQADSDSDSAPPLPGARHQTTTPAAFPASPFRVGPASHESPCQPGGGGMFGTLKKKFIGLPVLNKNERPISSFTPTGSYPPIMPTIVRYPPVPLVGGYPHNLPASSSRHRERCEERRNQNSPSVRPGQGKSPTLKEEDCGSRRTYGNEMARNDLQSHDSGTYESFQKNSYSDCQERDSRKKCNYRESLRDRRSISSDGPINQRASHGLHNVRSNSLDRCAHMEETCNEGGHHPFDCRCSTCTNKCVPNVQRSVCSFCRSSNHKSWCNRSKAPDPKPCNSASTNHSKHTHKSSNSGSYNLGILKDIAPVKRTPSPVIDMPLETEKPVGQHFKSSLKDHCSPLSSRRLKPTRQESKNAVLNILDDGEVCVEFLQTRKQQKRVHDVCRISPDGLRIVLYQPNGSYGTTIMNTPPCIPDGGADHIFSYDSLPLKFWKKYIYAGRFVNLVKEKTPKITYYSDLAQCILMENSPNPEFVSKFFSGERILLSHGKAELIQTNRQRICVAEQDCFTVFNSNVLSLYEHATRVKRHCLTLEKVLCEMEESVGLPNFPVIIGKRPSSSSFPPKRSTEDKENLSPMSFQSSRVQNGIGAYDDSSVASGASGGVTQRARRPLTPNHALNILPPAPPRANPATDKAFTSNEGAGHKVILENIGCFYQDNVEMVLNFIDGSRLQMTGRDPSGFTYTDSAHHHFSYSVNSTSIPSVVRDKLTQFHKALAKINSESKSNRNIPRNPKNISQEQSYSHKTTLRSKGAGSSDLLKYIR